MRLLIACILLCGFAVAQDSSAKASLTPESRAKNGEITIPSGTRVPVVLKNTISTKSNHVGDPIYAQSTFPVVVDDKIVVPAGTYVQGKISQLRRPGRVHGRAEHPLGRAGRRAAHRRLLGRAGHLAVADA